MTVLETLASTAAVAVTAGALLTGALTLAVSRDPALALGVLLDLLVAAGLLRLAGDPSWSVLATTAAVVALRHLIGVGLRLSRSSSAASSSGAARPAGSRRSPAVRSLVRPAWRA